VFEDPATESLHPHSWRVALALDEFGCCVSPPPLDGLGLVAAPVVGPAILPAHGVAQPTVSFSKGAELEEFTSRSVDRDVTTVL